MANETVTPAAGSLAITTSDAEFINSGDMRLIISSDAPTILFPNPVTPGAGSLGITGAAPARLTGLKLNSDVISAEITHIKSTGVASLSFSSTAPLALTQSPPSFTVAPDAGSLSVSGQSATVDATQNIPVASLSLTGGAVTISNGTTTFRADYRITGYAPTAALSGTLAIIGTQIENDNATTDTQNRYNICDRSGFKAKPGELVQTWDGYWVLPQFYEPRNIQDFVTSKAENQKGATRPEPVGSERFIEDEFPNDVTQDDL